MIFQIDHTHDPALECWVDSACGHPDFPVQNLPYGIFATDQLSARPGVAIGDWVLDLHGVAKCGLLPGAVAEALRNDRLNALLAASIELRQALRMRLSELLTDPSYREALEPFLHARSLCRLELPVTVGDYTDFYVGIHHAVNVGRLFRPDAPLLPNYKHVPIGYHGRASSVRVSGEPVIRPSGQSKSPDKPAPDFGPTLRLDYELELGIWVAEGNRLGEAVPIDRAPRYIGGICLLNDWSARDLQAWEYQPLGPFLAKNFHSTISPWVVTPEALAPFWRPQKPRPAGDPAPLEYLSSEEDQRHGALGLELTATLSSYRMREAGLPPRQLSMVSATNMYWTVAQMLTHHASNGCNLRPGDLLGTGTISGASRESCGSLLEITRGGAEPIELPTGEVRTFIEDGDEVVFTARAERKGFASISLGECRAMIVRATTLS